MNTHAFVRMSALLNTWTAEHEALTDTIKELKQQLLAAERRADEWEDRARRANDDRSEMVQKVNDLRKRIGENMERDARIEPMADAKKPSPIAIGGKVYTSEEDYEKEREGVRT